MRPGTYQTHGVARVRASLLCSVDVHIVLWIIRVGAAVFAVIVVFCVCASSPRAL